MTGIFLCMGAVVKCLSIDCAPYSQSTVARARATDVFSIIRYYHAYVTDVECKILIYTAFKKRTFKNCSNRSYPYIRLIGTAPTALQTLYRPPTQSQNLKK